MQVRGTRRARILPSAKHGRNERKQSTTKFNSHSMINPSSLTSLTLHRLHKKGKKSWYLQFDLKRSSEDLADGCFECIMHEDYPNCLHSTVARGQHNRKDDERPHYSNISTMKCIFGAGGTPLPFIHCLGAGITFQLLSGPRLVTKRESAMKHSGMNFLISALYPLPHFDWANCLAQDTISFFIRPAARRCAANLFS